MSGKRSNGEANDLIRKNPVRFAEKMKAKRPVKRKEAFTQEVLALEPQHIEPDGSCIHIRQAVNMVKPGVPRSTCQPQLLSG